MRPTATMTVDTAAAHGSNTENIRLSYLGERNSCPITLNTAEVPAVYPLTPFLLAAALAFGPADEPKAVDAKQVLLQADDACKKVQYIEYVEEYFVGKDESKPPARTTTIRQMRADVPDAGLLPGKFLIEGVTRQGGKEARKFAFAYDGKALRVLDP